MSNKGAAQAIREYLRAKGSCTHAELISETVFDNVAIRYTLKDFLKRGEIEKTGDGYRYVGGKEAFPTKSDRVWKAMRYMRVFSSAEIAQLAKAEMLYVTDIIKRYKNAGLIERVGQRKRKVGRGYEALYRLVSKERERPILRRRQQHG